MFSYALTF